MKAYPSEVEQQMQQFYRRLNERDSFGFVKVTPETVQIPTVSSWMLGLLSLLLSMVVFWRRRWAV